MSIVILFSGSLPSLQFRLGFIGVVFFTIVKAVWLPVDFNAKLLESLATAFGAKGGKPAVVVLATTSDKVSILIIKLKHNIIQ
jgi:hypothetical protein